MKNDVVLINFNILGGSGVYAPPGKFFNVSISETVSCGKACKTFAPLDVYNTTVIHNSFLGKCPLLGKRPCTSFKCSSFYTNI